MTLATVAETTRPRPLRPKASAKATRRLDAILLAVSLAICGLLFTEGGLEACAGALIGAVVAARQAPRAGIVGAAISGAFAGLFAGALLSGLAHGLIDGATRLL